MIESTGDSLFLEYQEIINPDLSVNYNSIIEKRKNEYKKYKNIEKATRYIETTKGLKPVEKINSEIIKSVIKGKSCSSGIVTAKVKLLKDSSNDYKEVKDCIIIAKNIEPGWISMFINAAGIITERGSLLSHTSILCREIGIPAIIGARDITKNINETSNSNTN